MNQMERTYRDALDTGALTMEHATILISLVCNLKCKLCSAFSPYYTDAKHPDLENEKEALRKFFHIVSYVDKFTICGGEPLLYPFLAEVLDFLQQYKSKIGLMEILTNGTIIPSEKLLYQMRRYEKKAFCVLIDDYGSNLSRNVPRISDLLTQSNISYMVRNYTHENPHCGGWVDFGDLTVKKCLTQEAVEEKYSKCAYPQKLGFSFAIGPDGCMFPCGPSRRCRALGVIEGQAEYINLLDDSLSAEAQRNKISAVLHGRSLEACAYCNGLCEDSPRFMPAEQLDRV